MNKMTSLLVAAALLAPGLTLTAKAPASFLVAQAPAPTPAPGAAPAPAPDTKPDATKKKTHKKHKKEPKAGETAPPAP
jgi:hypothetical protein